MKSYPRGIRAVGFDLGETLLTYRDTPSSWAPLYRASLSDVAGACAFWPTDTQFATAEAILAEHNTRMNPRVEEIPAEQIFRRVLEASRLSPEYLHAAIGAYFRFFQTRRRSTLAGWIWSFSSASGPITRSPTRRRERISRSERIANFGPS